MEQPAVDHPAIRDHEADGRAHRAQCSTDRGQDLSVPTESGCAEEDLEAGRLLFAQECRFMRGVARLDDLPPAGAPEVAFAGRSNVGKSSLVNALTGRRTLARTSNTPGRTRELNFFDLGQRLVLVDMPGYGFARASKTDARRWNEMVRAYLRGRAELRRLCLLVDSRHGLKPSDRELMDMLDAAAVQYQIVLTKADKTPRAVLEGVAETIAGDIRTRAAASPEVLVTSAETGAGIPLLRARLATLALPAPAR